MTTTLATVSLRPSAFRQRGPRPAGAGAAVLALPLISFSCAFVAAPLLMLLLTSLSQGELGGDLTAANFARFLSDGLSLPIVAGTLALGCESALLSLILGYPIALIFVSAPARLQRALIFVIVLPLLTSAVVRTFAWVVILGRQGLINEALLALGLTSQPVPLLYTEAGLVVAMAQVELPLMVLPLISSLSAIDPKLREASLSLGVGPWGTLFRVILPLSVPGAVAGLVLVFAASCSALITQSIVGGGRLIFAPLYIYQLGIQAQDWPFAATLSVTLLVSVLCAVASVTWIGNRLGGAARG